jgi:two-component system, chemotaxis family, sensor kinase CheA
LITDPDSMSNKDIFNLVFHPGFSMAEKVTNVSGRGVGMDVVKRGIEALRGSVDIDSTKDVGTTITVKLPLTLAIIEGLQVRVGDEFFVIPLAAVQECVELTAEERGESNGDGKRIINLRNEIVPFIRLREWFDVPGENPEIEQIIIAGDDNQRTGIVVDEVVGQQQTVIKSLGKVFRNVEEFSGATIKGDGTMALILDVPNLVRKVMKQCAEAEAARP